MKKSNIASIIIFATLICVALDSCQKKDDVQKTETEVSVTSFYARSSGSGSPSKTSRQETGSVWWSPNDEITAFCGETSGKFVSQNEESADVATFIGSFDSPVSTSDVSSKGVVAFYPYSEDLSCSEGTITFSLPASQPALAGTFDEELYPLIARSNSTELSFYNICGGAKFTVSQDGIKTVTFKGNASEPLAGKLSVTFDENGMPTVEVLEGETEIVVTAPDDGTFEVGKEYYIVTIPQSLAKGFTLIYNDGLSINNEFKTDKAITIRRSKFGVLKYLDEDLGMINLADPIEFEDPAVEKTCVANWDTDGDGSLSYAEAAAVKSIGTVFESNKSITSFDELRYFTGLSDISWYAFSNCSSLASVVIPEGVTSIGYYAFSNCSSLASVVIPEGVTSIAYHAFDHCSSLASVVIPEGVTSIESSTFYYCYRLASVTIPSSVTSIGKNAFYYCTALKDVHISDVASWCNISFELDKQGRENYSNPFCYARNLYLNGELVTDLIIPEGVTSISYKAFRSCNSLTSVTIPSSVTSIEIDAFYNCSGLTRVYISDIATWCSIDFEANNSGTFYYAYNSNPLYYARNLYLNGVLLTDLVIPEGVTSIGNAAFSGCKSLTSVTIPSSVTSIGDDAFYNCSGLTRVYISDIATWCSIDFEDCPLYYAKNLYLNDELVTDLIIPEGVTSIGSIAFQNCSSLTSVVIPEGVTSIGSSAFSRCSSLTSVTIPSSVTLIGNHAFRYCSGLTSVVIPEGVTSIGNYAFEDCSGLELIICKALCPPALDSWPFLRCNIVNIFVPGESRDAYCSAAVWKDYVGEMVFGNSFSCDYKEGVYELLYPVSGEESIEVSSMEDWISDITVSGAIISYKVALNTSAFARTGLFIITSNGKSERYEVIQKCHPVTQLSLNKTSMTLYSNMQETLTATVYPSDAALEWSSSDPSVASVDQNGKVTGLDNGITTISVKNSDGTMTATCSVTVIVPVTGICLDKESVEIYKDESFVLTAAVTPSNAAEKTVIWNSSNNSVATVDSDGRVYAVNGGTTTITASSHNGKFTASCVVTVLIHITDINLDYHVAQIARGETMALKATADPLEATGQPVIWHSSDPSVATVSQEGVVTAHSRGVAIITVTTKEGGISDFCEVSVFVPVIGVNLDQISVILTEGDSMSLMATILPEDADDKELKWTSSDTSVATVSQTGNVTAVKIGVSKITVTAADGGKSATCTVTVIRRTASGGMEGTEDEDWGI